MQLGFVSAILPDQTLEQVFQTAAHNGYDCVELMCWPAGKAERRYAGVTHLEAGNFTADDAARVRELSAKHGVAISALGYYPNPLAPDQAEAQAAVAHLKRVFEAAALLGLPTVNTFIGRNPAQSVDASWPRLLETWRPLLAFAKNHGVRVAIEHCPMLFGPDEWPGGKNIAVSPAIWRRLFNDLGDGIGLNYDPSHMVWQHMDYLAPMREFKDRLFHVHAKDARVDREKLNEVGILAHPNLWHTPKLPGLGDVEWGRFFSVLTDTGYRGPVCVEVEDRAYEGPLENRLAALRQSHDFLRNFVPGR